MKALLPVALLLVQAYGAVITLQYPCSNSSTFFDTAGLQCTSCPADAGQVPSVTGLYCVQCDSLNGTATDSSGRPAAGGWTSAVSNGTSCACRNGTQGQIVEFDPFGAPLLDAATGQRVQRCLECTAGTVFDSATRSCLPCSFPQQVQAGACVCPANGSTLCVPPDMAGGDLGFVAAQLGVSFDASRAFQVTLQNVLAAAGASSQLTVSDSALLVQLLGPAALGCLQNGTRQACNAVGNICAMELYSQDALACQIFSALQQARAGQQYHHDSLGSTVDWPLSLPWLTYNTSDASSLLEATDIQSRFVFSSAAIDAAGASSPAAQSFQLTLVASRFAVNGTWLGFANVTSSQLQLCSGPQAGAGAWLAFGQNYRLTCTLDVPGLVDQLSRDGTVLQDLYLQDGPDRLVPVPVQLDTPTTSTAAGSPMQLVRRFFLADTGLATAVGAAPAALQYVQSAQLVVTSQAGVHSAIYPPLLKLQYATVALGSSVEATSSFQAQYNSSANQAQSVWTGWTILLIVFLVLAGALWVLDMVAYTRRRGEEPIDIVVLVYGVTAGAKWAARGLFVALLLMGLYWCFFYKLQSTVRILILPNEELGRFTTAMIVCLSLQAVAVAAMVSRQTCLDIFFIDWERARRVVPRGGGREEAAPVSCWRTLFVANEWNELQTLRLTSPAFSLFLLVFLLSGLRLENAAAEGPQTSLQAQPYQQTNQFLRFGIGAGLLLAIGLGQVLFKCLLYHPYVSHPLHDFVDLLFLSNISCILLTGRVSGHYIHGRNQSQYSDTSLQELNLGLLKEEEGLVANRGLLASGRLDIRENQTFLLYIPRPLREKYENTMLRLIEQNQVNARMRKGPMGAALQGPSRPEERMMQARDTLSTDFKSMVSQVESNAGMQVLEQSFVGRMTGVCPPAELTRTKPVLVHDMRNSFASVLFYGAELDLFLLDTMVFAVVNMATQRACLAAAVAFAIWLVVKWLRQRWGENNLSRKAMVDTHFLI